MKQLSSRVYQIQKQFKSKHKYLFSVSILEITQLHYSDFIKEENKPKLIIVNGKKEGVILGYSEME